MVTSVESLVLSRPHVHSCSPACVPLSRLYHRMRNALQSLSNCAYLVARDPGVSPENKPLLAQMQADVAMVSVLLRRVSTELDLESLDVRKEEL